MFESRFPVRGAIHRHTASMGLLGLLALGAGCANDTTSSSAAAASQAGARARGLQHAGSERQHAQRIVWNPAPGDPSLPVMPPGRSNADDSLQVLSAPRGPTTPPPSSTTLVLYDSTGSWGYLGELYATGAANLASHFGAWVAKPASAYTCGDALNYRAVLYMGSTYDEPLPTCMLDDIARTTKPVVWSFYNLWELSNRMTATAFATRFGFTPATLDFTAVANVRYKNHTLNRYTGNAAGIMNLTISDPTRATVLAEAVRPDGTTFPWATRSGNLTFVAEIPFAYMTEEDRTMIYSDLLFDALAPTTTERHRAIVRLEDISPESDPAELRAVADYLYSQHVPFGFGFVSEYKDPLGYYNGGVPDSASLRDNPEVVSALQYMQSHGGVMVMHGQTHQWSNQPNPYTAVTGDDDEFFRVTENADHTLNFLGPVPGDSSSWASGRISHGLDLIRRANLIRPAIWEFPHYAASAVDYRAVNSSFTTRWERSLYFNGVLRGTTPTYTSIFGQFFPYVVRDVYGARVLPENLGNIEPEPFYIYPMRLPDQIIAAANDNLVVRDGVVGFYFHPFFDIAYLQQTVEGIRALGYTFVSPSSLESPP